jgi:sulfite exporter TauE/SafE
MLAAFLLGLAGSFTHCVGMCSGVMLLLGRGRNIAGWRLLVLHGGRIAAYVLLGALAGLAGHTLAGATGLHNHGAGAHELAPAWPGLAVGQGALALISAAVAVYMALALLGRAPSPELLLMGVTRWWGRTALSLRGTPFATRQSPSETPGIASAHTTGLAMTFFLGLFWGLLPCGLTLAGLLLAGAGGSLWAGATTMLAFGLGTLPLGLGVGWTAGRVRPSPQWIARLRPLAALIVFIFGAQMALRGLAAWGWVAHTSLGAMPLW